jgi:hypothetical protein
MKNNKILPFLIIGILLASGMSAVATIKNKNDCAPISDEIDQSQTIWIENILMPIGQIEFEGNLTNIQVAQSFIPSKEILTRVELYIGKNDSAIYPLYVSIRNELTEEDLTIKSVEPSLVPTGEFGWVEIDLLDVVVIPGHNYYLVAITENETDNWYGWGANNDSESYPSGCAWFSYDEGDSWTNKSSISNSHNSESSSFSRTFSTKENQHITWDMCFKTFGRENVPPIKPVINGPRTARYNTSQSFIFTTNDPDGDDVFYQILWGDATSEEWIGPYNSDELVTVNHTWLEQGIYIIAARAKDIYGYVGDWVEFEIEIPRNRQTNLIILNWLFDRFPLIRFFLGLN